MNRSFVAAIGALSFVAPALSGPMPNVSGREQIQVPPTAREFTLMSGMKAVVIPDHRAPVVTHMVWYRVGSADERAGESGLAHLLEHLMFKGTTAHPGLAPL